MLDFERERERARGCKRERAFTKKKFTTNEISIKFHYSFSCFHHFKQSVEIISTFVERERESTRRSVSSISLKLSRNGWTVLSVHSTG